MLDLVLNFSAFSFARCMMDILNYHTTRNCHCALTVTAGQGETAAVSDWDKQCACSTIDGDAGAHQCSVRAPLADTHHVVGKAARFTFSKEPTNHSLSMCNAVRVESTQINATAVWQINAAAVWHDISFIRVRLPAGQQIIPLHVCHCHNTMRSTRARIHVTLTL